MGLFSTVAVSVVVIGGAYAYSNSEMYSDYLSANTNQPACSDIQLDGKYHPCVFEGKVREPYKYVITAKGLSPDSCPEFGMTMMSRGNTEVRACVEEDIYQQYNIGDTFWA